MSLFEAQFVVFLIVVHENEWHFLESWENLENMIGMLCVSKFEFENLTYFDLIWPHINLSSGQI